MSILLEVCVSTLRSAVAAHEGGAQRLELCVNLAEGGISPPAALIKEVRDAVDMSIHVMIRPRPGDFRYSRSEFRTMKQEIQRAKKMGANGVVLGILRKNKTVDLKRTKELVSLAYPLGVTFHRAFDETPDPFEALEDIIESGADVLLTSGQETSASKGIELLCQLVQKAGKRIRILAGGGINESNAPVLIRETGVQQIHVATGVQKNGETDALLVSRLVFSINGSGGMN